MRLHELQEGMGASAGGGTPGSAGAGGSSLGLPYPSTYEEENDKFKYRGPQKTVAMTTEEQEEMLEKYVNSPAFVEALEKIYPRDELPQIKGKNLDDEYSSEQLDIPISKLKPSQDERIKKYLRKAERLLKKGKEKPIIIDKNKYIVNGHHRYDAYKKLKYKTIPAIKVNATVEELIDKYM